jgi:hypothetical protein
MMHTRKWHAEVFLFEQDGQTRADVVLETGESTLRGHGEALCHSGETDVPEIGDELAVARALADLARKLSTTAADDLEGIGQSPAHLAG